MIFNKEEENGKKNEMKETKEEKKAKKYNCGCFKPGGKNDLLDYSDPSITDITKGASSPPHLTGFYLFPVN